MSVSRNLLVFALFLAASGSAFAQPKSFSCEVRPDVLLKAEKNQVFADIRALKGRSLSGEEGWSMVHLIDELYRLTLRTLDQERGEVSVTYDGTQGVDAKATFHYKRVTFSQAALEKMAKNISLLDNAHDRLKRQLFRGDRPQSIANDYRAALENMISRLGIAKTVVDETASLGPAGVYTDFSKETPFGRDRGLRELSVLTSNGTLTIGKNGGVSSYRDNVMVCRRL